jgi:dTMP kinase
MSNPEPAPGKHRFIAIEGTDGSGKGTHTKLLADWLKSQSQQVEVFDFPQYGQPSAYFVERYLNGDYGQLSDIGPYRGSLFYALDRFDAGFKIRAALELGKIVLTNRYMASNMGHQGGKIGDSASRRRFFEWDTNLEYEILGIPRPNLNIVLHMPSRQAQKFVDQKAARLHLGSKKRDLHENSLAHLQHAEHTYLEICRLFPESFSLIECNEGERIKSIEDIQNQIRALVAPLISTQTANN